MVLKLLRYARRARLPGCPWPARARTPVLPMSSGQRILVSPELADVLSAIISRLRGPGGDVPLTVSYDVRERIWNPPMPLLFQRPIGSENRAFTPSAVRKLLISALAATGLTDAVGDPLMFSPHDFRRIFVTDAIMSGLPPHIAQVICGHKTIDTTIGYKNSRELHQTGEEAAGQQLARLPGRRSGVLMPAS